MADVKHPNSGSFIKLRKLSNRHDEPVADILTRAMSEWHGPGTKGTTFQLRINHPEPGKPREVFNIALNANGARLQKERLGAPTLTVVLGAADFRRIADGSYSPVQAYLDGALHLQGDVELGRGIIKHFTGSGTQAGVCPTLVNESWQSDHNGFTGTLTLSGEFFTPNGVANVVYDYGSGQYQRLPVADASGNFTISEPSLFCGDIPGHPGVGVIVTAFDLNSGLSTTQSYATPC